MTNEQLDALTTRGRLLRNYCGTDHDGEDPYLAWHWEWEDRKTGELGTSETREPVEDDDRHRFYPQGISVMVADHCTMAEVPPFDGQQMEPTARAIAGAGRDILDLVAEVRRLGVVAPLLEIAPETLVEALSMWMAEFRRIESLHLRALSAHNMGGGTGMNVELYNKVEIAREAIERAGGTDPQPTAAEVSHRAT